MSSLDGALRKGKRAGLELCEFAGRRDRGWGGRLAVCGGVCACALSISKEGPLGTISVRFNSSS